MVSRDEIATRMGKYIRERDFKNIIDTYEQYHDLLYKDYFVGDLHFIAGHAYYFAEAPYKNVDKAIESFNKSINLGFYCAKSYLAFCYIFGDGVPEDLQKAVALFKEAHYEGTQQMKPDFIADFMLHHLIDMSILLNLLRLKKTDDIKYALSTPLRRQSFSCINHPRLFGSINPIGLAEGNFKTLRNLRQTFGKPIESDRFCYDPSRLKTLSDIWASIYDSTDLCTPDALDWIRFLYYEKSFSKEQIINEIGIASRSLDVPQDTEESNESALYVYKVAIVCFTEICKLPPIFERVDL